MPAPILGFSPVTPIPQCSVSIHNIHIYCYTYDKAEYVLNMYVHICFIFVGRRLGSPINAWESYQAPAHTTHSPQHSTASSNSITATPTISPGVSIETQPLSLQHQQLQQQPPALSNSQPVAKVAKRFGAKRMSRPMSMANFFDHNIETPSNPPGQRRGEFVHEYMYSHLRTCCVF